jgi:hypothetical protein
MTLDSLTITLTDTRLIDGWVAAANANGYTPEALALEFLQQQGRSYADLNKVGVITSASLMARFTPTEYGTILAATVAPDDATEEQITAAAQVQALLSQLMDAQTVYLDDPELERGLALLVAAGLLDPSRPAEIAAYDRPEPLVNDTSGSG